MYLLEYFLLIDTNVVELQSETAILRINSIEVQETENDQQFVATDESPSSKVLSQEITDNYNIAGKTFNSYFPF